MRFQLAFFLVALQTSMAAAALTLKQCGTSYPSNWVSNCSAQDKQGCKTLCAQKCRTDQGRQMANGQNCDCYCG